MKENRLKDTAKKSVVNCRGSLAWLGRQTHNLESHRGKRLIPRGRGLESRSRHHFSKNPIYVKSYAYRRFTLSYFKVIYSIYFVSLVFNLGCKKCTYYLTFNAQQKLANFLL